MDWSTPEDLQEQVNRLWQRGRLLGVGVHEGAASFPLDLRLKRPTAAELGTRFDDVRAWVRRLEEESRARRGFGYDVAWSEINHRQLGRNRIPVGAFVPTKEDALRLVGKQRAAERFERLASRTREVCPELETWIGKKPLALLDHADDWERILAVVLWFRANPRPGIYLRQLDIRDVDTKFVEARRGLLTELLDAVLPPEQVDQEARRHFEARYGLRSKPALVRLRILDPRHHLGGLSDLSVPAAELARWSCPARRVFITENEINGLAFPAMDDALVIFGLGYSVERLDGVGWLLEKEIHYWGDIDTHGFAILDRLRARFPRARSLLMDRETLLEHRPLWVQEDAPHPGGLTRLTGEEDALLGDLLAGRLGERIRLEQERIRFGWVTQALEHATRPAGRQGSSEPSADP
jgi:hypothetical protein